MASLNGLKLMNVTCEEYVGNTEFVFGELYFDKPIGEFIRRRSVPKYAQHDPFNGQYVPSYMYMSIANTSFTWYEGAFQGEINSLCKQIVDEMNPNMGSMVIRLIDCLFHLDMIEKTWYENDCIPIQCVWNNKAYRIYGLEGTSPFSPFDETIQQIAKGFAHDFGQAKVSWFENEDDFDLCGSGEETVKESIQFVC